MQQFLVVASYTGADVPCFLTANREEAERYATISGGAPPHVCELFFNGGLQQDEFLEMKIVEFAAKVPHPVSVYAMEPVGF